MGFQGGGRSINIFFLFLAKDVLLTAQCISYSRHTVNKFTPRDIVLIFSGRNNL